jgi:hypothetical protein
MNTLLASGVALYLGLSPRAMADAPPRPGEVRKREVPMQCRLLVKKTTESVTRVIPAEVELENPSPKALTISFESHPLQYLDLEVTDGAGKRVSQGYYGYLFSPGMPPQTLNLAPGQKYRHTVSLFGTVPNVTPGKYRIKAIYRYNSLHAESDAVEVELTK